METNNSQQEVDIIQFFKAIGDFFRGIKNSIKVFFLFIFHSFIKAIIYVKNYALYFAIGVILGLIYAFVFRGDYNPIYVAEVKLKTNFDSASSFSNKINELNGFIQSNSFDKLANELGISKEDAKKITGFELRENINDVELIKEYEDYLIKMDTVVYKYIEYKDFRKNINKNPQLFPFKYLKVYANSANVFSKLNNKLEHLLDNDVVLQERKKEISFTLSTQKREILRSLQELDTLREVFNQAYLDNAKQSNPGSTNIVVSNQKLSGAEAPVNIYYNRIVALKELEKINNHITDKRNILELYSRFPEVGVKESPLRYNPFIKFPVFGFLLVLLILLLLDFNKYINKYQKDNMS